ncbi:aspartyl-phosphate phosphatase Spo0E family protein [Neobacillus citreus]|uniref:Aspartyl-phosphate phosphatase Spo0E family protein n=1 Tax=Neobacillus citreus TaxID=2833578 RepID=A0A942T0D5_9BACI|nr:aspartyl-phosphate phosphatase Spo0E family protein [Neobacillus citreus]MCH6268582.1 aspartyl-phosphate phosphatase Spo0E family protein [Neobacillus citreus]
MNLELLELLLQKRIADEKKKLIKIAQSTGINSNQTITCSQELDKLINQHMKNFSNQVRTFVDTQY